MEKYGKVSFKDWTWSDTFTAKIAATDDIEEIKQIAAEEIAEVLDEEFENELLRVEMVPEGLLVIVEFDGDSGELDGIQLKFSWDELIEPTCSLCEFWDDGRIAELSAKFREMAYTLDAIAERKAQGNSN